MTVLAYYIPLGLLVVLASELIQRRAYEPFPWFSAYVGFGILAGVARFLVRNHAGLYFHVYWDSEIGYLILSIAALYEVFRAVFRNLQHTWWFPLLFPASLMASFAVIAMHTWKSPPHISDRAFAWFVTFELGVRVFQGLLFAVLVFCVAVFGLRWRQYAFGIATGFGFYATVALLTVSKFSDFGTKVVILLGWVLIGAYSVTALIWIWFFRKPQKPDPPGPEITLLQARKELEEYRRFIQRIRDL
jgi:hypothetical protein